MRFLGIHHLAFCTGDLTATVHFWRDLLGLPLVHTMGGPGYRQYFFAVSPSDMIVFFEWPDIEVAPRRIHGQSRSGPAGFDHVALGMADEAGLWDLVARLQGAGFAVSDVVDHGFLRSLYTHDPNGIALEFSCDVAGVDVRMNPSRHEREPLPVALEGSAPVAGRFPAGPALPLEEREVVRGEGWAEFAAQREGTFTPSS